MERSPITQEVFVTKLPSGFSMADLIAELMSGGYDTRSKEEVDAKLADMGMEEDLIAKGSYIRVTFEEIE